MGRASIDGPARSGAPRETSQAIPAMTTRAMVQPVMMRIVTSALASAEAAPEPIRTAAATTARTGTRAPLPLPWVWAPSG